MAQKRFTDRGRPYDHEAWRSLYKNTLTPGVYSGYTMSPSELSASRVTIAAGALLLPTGIVVVEDTNVNVQINGIFPPSSATNYTVRTHHREAAMGLIGGEAMTYLVVSGLLTEQPSDGVILGWIRHPGGGIALEESHITNAPRYAPADVAADFSVRRPLAVSAPNLVTELGEGISHSSGYGSSHAWRGFSNPSSAIDPATGVTPTATSYFQYPVYARPWEISIRSIIPIGDKIIANVYDTAGVLVISQTLTSHTNWSVDTISVPTNLGTFTMGEKATIKIVSTVSQGTIVKIADIVVDFWPYAFPQF